MAAVDAAPAVVVMVPEVPAVTAEALAAAVSEEVPTWDIVLLCTIARRCAITWVAGTTDRPVITVAAAAALAPWSSRLLA